MANKKKNNLRLQVKQIFQAKKLADLEQTNGKGYEDQVARARELEDF